MNNLKKKWIPVGIALLIALISFFGLAGPASSTETSLNQNTIQYLGEKQTTVMELTAATTAASTLITLMPGDTGTPIADKLADFSSYFLIVLCAVLLEKYLVTVMGFAAFRILIPIGCLVLAASFLTGVRGLKDIGKKLLIFGLMIFLIIPSSVGISKMIETTYSDSIQQSINNATDKTVEEETENLADEAINQTTASDEKTDEEKKSDETHWYDRFNPLVERIQNSIETVEEAVTDKTADVTEKARNMMNQFMEALAVMLVTSCLIPILVVLFFLWLCKIIFGADLSGVLPPMPPMPRISSKENQEQE